MRTRLRSWLGSVLSRTRVERELADEIDFHLQARTEYWLRQGLSHEAAARRARIEFGAIESHKEEWRQARGLRLIDELRNDLVYGLRMLRASPGFTFISVAILGIAIGANVAVFNVLDAVLFRMLPVERPHELRELAWIQRAKSEWQMSYDGSQRSWEGGDRIATSFAYPAYVHLRDHTTSLTDLFLFTGQDLTVGVDGRERRLPALLVSGNFLRRVVRTAAFSRYGLLSGGATRDAIKIPVSSQGSNEIGLYIHYVSPRYFETMGIALTAGREFAPSDREKSPRVAIVNQSLARRLPFGGSPVQRRVLVDNADVEIIGVVADARFSSIRDAPPPTLYLPFRQYRQGKMTFMARTAGDPSLAANPIREVIEGIAPTVPVYEVRTQEAQIDAAIRQERLFAYAASGFAGLALLLACLGLYGTLAYSVARRTVEIGLRMALGADRWSVTSMVLRESLVPVLLGVALGVLTATMTTQTIQAMLFGLTPRDAPTIALATLALVVSALIAAWVPCRRASGVDPMTALRRE